MLSLYKILRGRVQKIMFVYFEIAIWQEDKYENMSCTTMIRLE
jgi:hypothetical protein